MPSIIYIVVVNAINIHSHNFFSFFTKIVKQMFHWGSVRDGPCRSKRD